ncbi:Succinate dehydrogenase, partial [Dysosmobacter welbionis]
GLRALADPYPVAVGAAKEHIPFPDTQPSAGTGEPVEGPLLHLVFRHSRLERPEVRAETCWGGGGGPAAQSVQNRKQFNICLFHLTGCTTLVRLCHRCSGR